MTPVFGRQFFLETKELRIQYKIGKEFMEF